MYGKNDFFSDINKYFNRFNSQNKLNSIFITTLKSNPLSHIKFITTIQNRINC